MFTIGAYGDVMRVKILFNKPNTALVQFADSQHAQTGKTHFLYLKRIYTEWLYQHESAKMGGGGGMPD